MSDIELSKLHRVQGSLTVDLVMVEREDMLTCKLDELASQIKSKNTLQFSYLPVEDGGHIIGLYDASRWFDNEAPNETIEGDYLSLSEQIIIGADASIFDFLMQADNNPTNLVVSGNKVAGLISLHDIQQLPVRAALFALITNLELVMALAIEKRWPDDAGWMAKLSDGRFLKLAEQIEKSKLSDAYVNDIAFTQFSDKADLIRKAEILKESKRTIEKNFERIRDLRDDLAHANAYAQTEQQAKSVCETVRTLYQLKREMIDFISS